MYYNFTPLVESTLLEHSVTVFCGAQKNNFPHLLCSFGLANNPMKRRKCPEFIADEHLAVPGDTRPEDALGTWVFWPLWTKEKEAQAWNFKGKVGNIQINRKSKHTVNKFLLGHPETLGHRRKFNKQVLLDFLVSATFNSYALR